MKKAHGKAIICVIMSLILSILLASCAASSSSAGAEPASAAATQSANVSQEAPASDDFSIAMLFGGPINDGGWNSTAYAALQEAEKKYSCKIGYTENIKQNDQLQIIRQYAAEGYKVIVGHGYEFGDALLEVATEFPETKFMVFGGDKSNGSNMAAVGYKNGEVSLMAGYLFGQLSKTGKIGIISASEAPTTKQEMVNIEKMVLEANPDAEVLISITGDWADIAKAKEAAYSLAESGCDILVASLDAAAEGVMDVCREKNIMYATIVADDYDKIPDLIVTSVVQDASVAFSVLFDTIYNGEFEGKVYRLGLADGAQYLGRFGPMVTEEQQAELETMKQDIIDGKIELINLLGDF